MNAIEFNNSKEVTWLNAAAVNFYSLVHGQLHLFYLLIYLIIVMQHYKYIYILIYRSKFITNRI